MNLSSHISGEVFRLVGSVADEMGQPCYVVGGYVRDIFLNRESKDVDFVTVGSGIELAQKISDKIGRHAQLTVYPNFGKAQIKYHGL